MMSLGCWKHDSPAACLLVLMLAGVFGATVLAQDFGVTGEAQGTNFYLEYPSRTDAYFRVRSTPSLTSGAWAVRDIRLGSLGTQTWTDAGVLIASTLGVKTQAQFYQVGLVWLTNSLDYDGDGLNDAYELTNAARVNIYDPDSDSDGVNDGDEVHVYNTRPWNPYSGPVLYYTFDTNTQGWVSTNWGGDATVSWTNTGNPEGGSLAVALGNNPTSFAKVYIMDGPSIDNQDARLKPVARAYVYVPPQGALPQADDVGVKLRVRSSSDGWSYSNVAPADDYYFPAHGEWTLITLSNIDPVVLADADEWGLEIRWNPQVWAPTVLVDTVCQISYPELTSTPTFVYYTFDTNLQGWTSVDWGYGTGTLAWTNTGHPAAGALSIAPSNGTNYAKVYVKDGSVYDNQDLRWAPQYKVYVWVSSNAPQTVATNRVEVRLHLLSSSEGWTDTNHTDVVVPPAGQWTLITLSNITPLALGDVDEWGVEVVWNDRSVFSGPVLIDTVYHSSLSAYPLITSVTAVSNPVGKYQKFELDVGLTNTVGLNPYDPNDVNLQATFVSPSGRTWKIWGFYLEDPSAPAGRGGWKVRFAPNETGTWTYAVCVSNMYMTNSSCSATSTFECVTSSRHGWVRVSDNDAHYLEHDDDSPFIGKGYCRCWDGDDEGVFMEAEEHGINLIHWWMAAWDTMLTVDRATVSESWRERSSYYSYEQGRAAELDRIIQYAEKHNVKFVFTIWPHDSIRDFNYHKWRINGSWQKAFDHKFSEPEWYLNAFSKLDDPPKNQKFFYDAKYKKYQENLYRYIIARWGYSEAIGFWALASEMFGTFANSLNCINYQDPVWVTNKNAMFGENPFYNMDYTQCDGKDYTISWLTYINSFFKTNDPFRHPTTASYATDEYWEHGFPVVDITQIHTYADLYSWITPPVTVSKYHHYLNAHYNKPSFMGEIGTVDWKKYEPDYTRVTAWPGLCAGAASTPLMWTTPPFSWFGDAKMGPWVESMSDEMKVLSDFTADIDFHRQYFTPADVRTGYSNEPAETAVESFEGGLNGWAKHGDGVTSIEISTNHPTDGSQCIRLNVDIPTWAEMPSPEPGIEKYSLSYNWTSYWPNGTLKMDVYIPEFYDPETNPDGFLLGVNKDPRSVLEVHCATDSFGHGWTWYSTTNEHANEGGWKKLTVGMTYNLELDLSEITSAVHAANIKGIKFKFGNAGILKGPVYIDKITAGLYPFNTYGLISSNQQFAFAWIQDRRWTNVVTTGAVFRINGLAAGTYNLEWWNTRTGPSATFNADAATGTLSVTAPNFTKDVAVKIRRVGGIGSTNHDVAVAAVSDYDWVVKSATQRVTVLVVNQGSASETFNVTLTNTTDGLGIGTNSLTLAAGACSNTVFTWNCTNVADGAKTLTARAAPVSGETDTDDNQLTGLITVRSNAPPWDSCDRLRRWKEDNTDSDGRSLVVSTNYASEETHSFAFGFRSPSKYQAYFGYDQIYEDWSNKAAFVYDVYLPSTPGYPTNAQILVRSGANWDWYYSKTNPLTVGWTTNVTYYFHSNEWTKAVWNNGTTNWDYYPNVKIGGLEQMQQIFIKFIDYSAASTAYVDNIRLSL